MAVTPQDLLQPIGELLPGLFPGLTGTALEDQLQTYLTQGAALANATDASTAAYAYFRAYQAAYLAMVSAPISSSMQGEGSQTYSVEQIRALAAARDSWEARYTALLAVSPVATPGLTRMPTMSTANRYVR